MYIPRSFMFLEMGSPLKWEVIMAFWVMILCTGFVRKVMQLSLKKKKYVFTISLQTFKIGGSRKQQSWRSQSSEQTELGSVVKLRVPPPNPTGPNALWPGAVGKNKLHYFPDKPCTSACGYKVFEDSPVCITSTLRWRDISPKCW
jgi:hypothetical protein